MRRNNIDYETMAINRAKAEKCRRCEHTKEEADSPCGNCLYNCGAESFFVDGGDDS